MGACGLQSNEGVGRKGTIRLALLGSSDVVSKVQRFKGLRAFRKLRNLSRAQRRQLPQESVQYLNMQRAVRCDRLGCRALP